MLSASYIYNGMPDYWSGDGERWDADKGCLFAYFGPETTLRGMINEWVQDFELGGDCDEFPESVTSDDVRAALMDMLSPEGRRMHDADELAECAEFLDSEDWDEDAESPIAIVLLEYEDCHIENWELIKQNCFWNGSLKPLDIWFWLPSTDIDEVGPFFSEKEALAGKPNDD